MNTLFRTCPEASGTGFVRGSTLFLAAVLALTAVTVRADDSSGSSAEEDSSGEQFYYQPACLKESLKAGTSGAPGLRDFLGAFQNKWKSPGIRDYLKNTAGDSDEEPDWAGYPPEDCKNEEDHQYDEAFTARSYRYPDNTLYFALAISVSDELRRTESFCYYRFDDRSREYVPADLFDRRYDDFQGVDSEYLLSGNGEIVRTAGFLYDESEFPLYGLEQKYVWNGKSMEPQEPVLLSPVKLRSPASPDGKWDQLSLTDVDGDGIPEIFLSRRDTGAQDVFYGNTEMGRLSGISGVPASFRVSGKGIAVSDASGLNVSYTEIKNSVPGRMLILTCRNDDRAKNGKSCRRMLDGREVSEKKADAFIAELAVSGELRPEYITIREVHVEEVSGNGTAGDNQLP